MLEMIAAAFIGLAAAQSPDTTTVVTVQRTARNGIARRWPTGSAVLVTRRACWLVITASDNEAWRFISDY